MKVLGTPHIDKDPDLIECLFSNLDPGEQPRYCKKCGCPYLINYYFKEEVCLFCSDRSLTMGQRAQMNNRAYSKAYQRRKHRKRKDGNGTNK